MCLCGMSRGGKLCISFGVIGKLGVYTCPLKLTKVMQLNLFMLVHLLGPLLNVSSGCSFPIVGIVLANLGKVDFSGHASNCNFVISVLVVRATPIGVVLTTILYLYNYIYIYIVLYLF